MHDTNRFWHHCNKMGLRIKIMGPRDPPRGRFTMSLYTGSINLKCIGLLNTSTWWSWDILWDGRTKMIEFMGTHHYGPCPFLGIRFDTLRKLFCASTLAICSYSKVKAPATLSYVLRWVQQQSYRHYCLGEDKWTMNGFPIPYCTKNFQLSRL